MKKYLLASFLSVITLSTLCVSAQVATSIPDNEDPASMCITIPVRIQYQSKDYGTTSYVTLLQDFLHENNYLTSLPTGFFGAATVKAVKVFQKANGISETGSLGPITRAKIASITGCNSSSVNQTVSTISSGNTNHSSFTFKDSSASNFYYLTTYSQTVTGAGPNLKVCTASESIYGTKENALKLACASDSSYVYLSNQLDWSYNVNSDTYQINEGNNGSPLNYYIMKGSYVTSFLFSDGTKQDVEWKIVSDPLFQGSEFSQADQMFVTRVGGGCPANKFYCREKPQQSTSLNGSNQTSVSSGFLHADYSYLDSTYSKDLSLSGPSYLDTSHVARLVQTIKGAGPNLKACTYVENKQPCTEYVILANQKGWLYDTVSDTYSIDLDVSSDGFPATSYVSLFMLSDGTKRSVRWAPRTSKNAALPEGCSSSSGYSNVSGQACVKPFDISNLSRSTGYDYRSTLPLYYIGLKITGAGPGLKVCVGDPGVSCTNSSSYIDAIKLTTTDTRYGTVVNGWKYDATTDTYDSGYRNLYYGYTVGNYKYYFMLADGTKKSINAVSTVEPFKATEVAPSTSATQPASITCAADQQVFSDSGYLRCIPKPTFGPN